MKKTILAILVALSLIVMPSVKAARVTEVPQVTDHEKVKIYLFWASWCPHCHDFLEYFSDKYADYSDYFEIVSFQVDAGEGNNQVNSALMSSIGEVLGSEGSGIPFIIVGDWYQSGFGSDGTNIIEQALSAYQDPKYKDVVAETISKKNLASDPTSMSEALVNAGISAKETKEEEPKKSNDTLIVVIVFAVIILGFGGLFLYSRKN